MANCTLPHGHSNPFYRLLKIDRDKTVILPVDVFVVWKSLGKRTVKRASFAVDKFSPFIQTRSEISFCAPTFRVSYTKSLATTAVPCAPIYFRVMPLSRSKRGPTLSRIYALIKGIAIPHPDANSLVFRLTFDFFPSCIVIELRHWQVRAATRQQAEKRQLQRE